jgi:hypothetical protein
VWPIYLNFLLLFSKFISSCPVIFHRSLLEMMFGRHILSIYRRHIFTKVCISRWISFVTSQVSHPYKSTDFTQALNILIAGNLYGGKYSWENCMSLILWMFVYSIQVSLLLIIHTNKCTFYNIMNSKVYIKIHIKTLSPFINPDVDIIWFELFVSAYLIKPYGCVCL